MASSPPGSPTSKPSSHAYGQEHQSSSPADILANAKVVAEAARSASSNQADKVDKAAAAEAAEELLASASKYGKLGDEGLGSYVDQAETYLHKYHSSSDDHSTTPSTAAAAVDPAKKPAGSETRYDDDVKAEEGGDGGGGLGGYVKMAKGFLSK